MKQKHVALRQCAGCKEMKDKRQMARVVLSPDGGISIDVTGKATGRGAYVCKDPACVIKAAASKGFDRSFKRPVPKEVYETLKGAITGDE